MNKYINANSIKMILINREAEDAKGKKLHFFWVLKIRLYPDCMQDQRKVTCKIECGNVGWHPLWTHYCKKLAERDCNLQRGLLLSNLIYIYFYC